ncbi:MAG: Asp-tRNA(Asn)/Glu-tRNA(Gln) amidotransferase subunit GatA, partial [Lentisphaeria bacterium]|nr:Asp-tRNA(Asn)/Glu-tRNA(Gln) amidotransferase subunit GatA [Lentisphaeria bacterium]
IKDNLSVAGQPCTCASKILAGYTAPYDATAVARLRQAGFLMAGRTNMDEFAMGSSTENSGFGASANPWDLRCVPGGSSGGSAVAVAAREALAALGSDTGGSIRQPAGFCGIVGLKPTYGRVSRYGLVAYASSLDQIGPLTRDVRDAAILFDIIAGADPKDSTSLPAETTRCEAAAATPDVRGMRVGLPREYLEVDGLTDAVRGATARAADILRGLGAEIVDIRLPHTPYAIATYYIIATAEASANLARFDSVRYGFRDRRAETDGLAEMYEHSRAAGFGPEVKRRIILGTYVLSSGYYDAYYLRAQKVRTLIRQDFTRAFAACDLLLAPVAPTPAFRAGAMATPLQMYLADIYTISANLAGVPALCLPCERSPGTLPIGVQLMGPALGEETLFRAAAAFEEAAAPGPLPELPAGAEVLRATP